MVLTGLSISLLRCVSLSLSLLCTRNGAQHAQQLVFHHTLKHIFWCADAVKSRQQVPQWRHSTLICEVFCSNQGGFEQLGRVWCHTYTTNRRELVNPHTRLRVSLCPLTRTCGAFLGLCGIHQPLYVLCM